MLDGTPETWAYEYFERDVPIGAIDAVYHLTPLSEALVKELNRDRKLKDLREDIYEIGYPIAG
ncbi:MAG: hypothetical protein AAGA56_22965 [Myxococcota bacterium]